MSHISFVPDLTEALLAGSLVCSSIHPMSSHEKFEPCLQDDIQDSTHERNFLCQEESKCDSRVDVTACNRLSVHVMQEHVLPSDTETK